MRPFDEIPLEEGDYSDVALMVASVREWPDDDFVRELDARVARRFAPEASGDGRRVARVRLSRWTAGPAVALVAGAVATVVVLSAGTFSNGTPGGSNGNGGVPLQRLQPTGLHRSPALGLDQQAPAVHGKSQRGVGSAVNGSSGAGTFTTAGVPESTGGSGVPSSAGTSNQPNSAQGASQSYAAQTVNATAAAPVAPGGKQIRSAQISLTTPNEHVNQVARELFQVVRIEHGTVLNSQVTTATSASGGGYASFSLSIPTSNLQDAMTQLSSLHFAALQSSSDGSQNVSNQYDNDQRQLSDAQALRISLLKQLASAVTTQQIDSIKAQLKLAEQQVSSWQSVLGSLQHRISYSNVEVQINENGLPIPVYTRHVHHSGGFTIGRAGHDALRVLVVSAGVALIALAVMIPVGLVAALLMWLWVWLRQRRREHALDSAG